MDVIRNGGFDEILKDWGQSGALGDWIPYDATLGAASLHPEDMFSYRGTVIYQPLNVPVTPGDSLEVAVDLRSAWTPPPGNTVAVYLEYLDGAGTRQRYQVLNPTNSAISDGSWATFHAAHTAPAGMTKLVGIAFDKENDGSILADNVKVLSPTASGPVPHLGTVSPTTVAYGGNVVIQGEHFGTTPGEVTLGGSTNGVAVQSWSPQQIVVTVNDPCAGGGLMVEAGGVRSWQPRAVSIASPHYTLHTVPDTVVATPGQAVQLAVFVACLNGFEPLAGIQLTMPGYSSPVVGFSPNPVLHQGGTLLSFDTTGLTPGKHELKVQGTGGGVQPRETTFTLDVRQVAAVALFYTPGDAPVPLDGATLTTQGDVTFFCQVTDTDGAEITWDIPALPVTSSNPTAIEVFQDLAPWGNNALLVHGGGHATLTSRTPDGRTWDTSLNCAVPAEPGFVSGGFWASPMPNAPDTTNHFTVAGTDPISSVNWGYYSLGASIEDTTWGTDNKSFTGTFVLNEAAKPGDYLFYAAATMNGVGVRTGRRLQVVNAPGTGMIRGHTAQSGGAMHGHGANGTLEFYDATSGAKLFDQLIWEWSNDYTAVHVAPGHYKLRWLPDGWGSNLPEPQWYPNASSPSEAATVVVPADGTVSDVNFFLSPSTVPPPPPEITETPDYTPGISTFSINVQTEPDATYELHKSMTLLDRSWWPVASVYGDGQVQQLRDTLATGSVGFYRVVRK